MVTAFSFIHSRNASAAGFVVSTSFIQELNVKTGTIRNNTDRLFILACLSIFQNLIVVLIMAYSPATSCKELVLFGQINQEGIRKCCLAVSLVSS